MSKQEMIDDEGEIIGIEFIAYNRNNGQEIETLLECHDLNHLTIHGEDVFKAIKRCAEGGDSLKIVRINRGTGNQSRYTAFTNEECKKTVETLENDRVYSEATMALNR